MSELAKFLMDVKRQWHGFLPKPALEKLVKLNRLNPVLVRCGGGRFTCPAQDAQHFIDIITKEGSDYIRDVSIPAYTNYNFD